MLKRRHMDAALMSLLGLLAIGEVLYSAGGGEQVEVVLLAIVLSIPIITISSILIGYRRQTQRRVMPALIAPVLSLAVLISVAATHWPSRSSYALSRRSFDALAQRIRTGEEITTPVQAGLFVIRRAEFSPRGIVCLWTHPDPSGSTGFVQCGQNYVPFNLWSMITLDDRWQFISED